ncbi:unnamed protein product [Cylindrotheca closterium]|uniref:Kinesin-like protein n=1 Tax=Cylindrotheca closterium TaxID=2856 RepID=A0AAD2FPS7_9STRA|nr:unnamed protein product [Cylindrotheca closterium]
MTAPSEEGSKKKKEASSEGNVRVVLRVRPMAKYELEKGCKQVVFKVPVADPDSDGPEAVQVNQPDKRFFELDAVLDESFSQQQLYEKSGAYNAISEDLFKGFNCTILAYGQTGAGKTFSMGTAAGQDPEIKEMDGVIPRACMDLFVNIMTKCDGNAQVELSYLEVYNEEIRDLMTADSSGQQLRIRETLNGEIYVRGLTAVAVAGPAEVGKLMEEASGRRVVASTKMNATSSRSHAICVLRIKGVLDDTKFQSKLTLVDLAGSERMAKTGAEGSRAKEGISINKGLFVLGQVVGALAEQRPKYKRKPPFRDSKLTRLLQDSLGGNSRTIMIACCSPADFNTEETVNTLRYATQARNIKNSATANVIKTISQEEAMKLQRENTLLKQEVAELQETIRKLTEDSDVTPEEMNRSMDMIKAEQANHGGSSDRSKHLASIPSQEELEPDGALPEDDDVPIKNMDEVKEETTGNDDRETTSMGIDDVFSKQNDDNVSVLTDRDKKSYSDLEAENNALHLKLRQAQRDVKASVRDSAIELPALKVRVMMLEDELENSHALEAETEELQAELEQARDDRKSALLAARQLSDFMEKQKSVTGFRGDEINKDRMMYFNKRLEERWVNFVVVMLASFKEQMRLLGDYFEMVVRVVESPDILTMIRPTVNAGAGWWGNRNREKQIVEEKELRQRLLSEHIKFFNSRLLEVEDEIENRSESVEGIKDALSVERESIEQDLVAEQLFHDVFSKQGEKLLKHMTELMTGPLFSLPMVPAV